MSKIKKVLASITAVLTLALGFAAMMPTSASAACTPNENNPDCITGSSDAGACAIAGGKWNEESKTCSETNSALAGQLFGDNGIVTRIISVVVFIIGGLCVIFLVYGGVQYILSAGDSGKVTNAKNTILYAVIGLIICIVAYALVQFILRNIAG